MPGASEMNLLRDLSELSTLVEKLLKFIANLPEDQLEKLPKEVLVMLVKLKSSI